MPQGRGADPPAGEQIPEQSDDPGSAPGGRGGVTIGEIAVFCASASPELAELTPVPEALHGIARSLTAHIPGRETVTSAEPAARHRLAAG